MRRRHAQAVLGVAIGLGAVLPAALPVAATIQYPAHATASQVVPGPGLDGASAELTLTLVPWAGDACVGILIDGFDLENDPITAIAIHAGAVGSVGPVVVELNVPDPPNDNGTCTSELDPAVLEAIADDPSAYYVEADTPAYPGGAVRGQLSVQAILDSLFVSEVACPGSVAIPSGPDVSVLFEKCSPVVRPGDIPAPPVGFKWRIKPTESELALGVVAGDATTATLAEAQALNLSFCNGTTKQCDAALLYEWQGLPAGTMSVASSTERPKLNFQTAIVVDGDGDVRASVVDKKTGRVTFASTGDDSQIYVYFVVRK